ncbi:MAG TPA: four helix bundle protein [Longimicrobiales bacterium]|nr:four helix bundle protein [Longimicrobiales bacterium]
MRVVFCYMQGYTGKQHGPEKLRVYHLALAFARSVDALLGQARCGRSLFDQLIRAAESIILNIAEGAGHFSPGSKRRHYQIAHASAAECIGSLARLADLNPSLDLRSLRRDGDMISVMLTALIRRLNKPAPNPDPT